MPVTLQVSTNDTAPYKCVNVASNTSVTGTVASPTYRLGCELPCDRFLDCSTVCECWSSCKTTEVRTKLHPWQLPLTLTPMSSPPSFAMHPNCSFASFARCQSPDLSLLHNMSPPVSCAQICMCKACMALAADASTDQEFQDVMSASGMTVGVNTDVCMLAM